MKLKIPSKCDQNLAEFVGISLVMVQLVFIIAKRVKEKFQYNTKITCNAVDDSKYIKYLEGL
ncbi:MAG: hypothetical protein JW789_01560 [Candidatus Aenigmarchaeota archaeon]|nr:hypothetical protein [Candidatus Aenigmarchaeota archaeon]